MDACWKDALLSRPEGSFIFPENVVVEELFEHIDNTWTAHWEGDVRFLLGWAFMGVMLCRRPSRGATGTHVVVSVVVKRHERERRVRSDPRSEEASTVVASSDRREDPRLEAQARNGRRSRSTRFESRQLLCAHAEARATAEGTCGEGVRVQISQLG